MTATRKTPEAPEPGLDARRLDASLIGAGLIEASQRGLLASAMTRQHTIGRLSRLGEEGPRFMQRRLEEDRRALHEFAACRTVPESLSACTGFCERSARQYGEAAVRLSGLCSAQLGETIDDLRHEVAAGIVPLRVDPAGDA